MSLRLHSVRIVSPRYSPPYPVLIGYGLADGLGSLLREYTVLDPRQCMVVYPEPLAGIAERVARSLGVLCRRVENVAVPDGEEAKSLDTLLMLVEKMHTMNLSRRDLVVVVGGGAASDVAGFAAAVYKRGIPYVGIPTSLLAMVDAGIGGKTAVNYRGLKNFVGAFYQPRAVIEDLELLKTLPESEWYSGLGEIFKYALTLSEPIYSILAERGPSVLKDEELLAKVVYYSVDSKARIVELDEREEYGVREILNFGHTVGHAVEEALMGRVKHGIAVAWGCVIEAWVGYELGFTPLDVARDVERLASTLGFPRIDIPGFDVLSELIRRDKKVHGNRIRGVFTLGPGRGIVVEVSVSDYLRGVRHALKHYRKE